MPTVPSVHWSSFIRRGVSFPPVSLLTSTHCLGSFPACTSSRSTPLSTAGLSLALHFYTSTLSRWICFYLCLFLSVQSLDAVRNRSRSQHTLVSRYQTHGPVQPDRSNAGNADVLHNKPDRCELYYCMKSWLMVMKPHTFSDSLFSHQVLKQARIRPYRKTTASDLCLRFPSRASTGSLCSLSSLYPASLSMPSSVQTASGG